MTTSVNISVEDWRRVKLLAADIADAKARGQLDTAKKITQEILRCLDELIKKYGPQASLLATKMNYVTDLQERIRFYTEAYETANSQSDRFNASMICFSLAKLYIDGARDAQKGEEWVNHLKESLIKNKSAVGRDEFVVVQKRLWELQRQKPVKKQGKNKKRSWKNQKNFGNNPQPGL